MKENKISRKKFYQQGLIDGFKQGKIQEKKVCADKMKELNIDLNIIKKVTGLSIKEILADYNK